MRDGFIQLEQASVDMFRHLLEKNPQVRDEFERYKLSIKEHGEFIQELMMGEPGEVTPQVSTFLLSTLCV